MMDYEQMRVRVKEVMATRDAEAAMARKLTRTPAVQRLCAAIADGRGNWDEYHALIALVQEETSNAGD